MVLAAAAPAGAVLQVTHDSAGRPIHFDVQATGADVAGYTAILDGLLHGQEISDVTVTIVPQSSIAGRTAGRVRPPATAGARAATPSCSCRTWRPRRSAAR